MSILTIVNPNDTEASSNDSDVSHMDEHSQQNSAQTFSADDFQALEQKIHRAVEIVRREREARAVAEAEAASLRQQLDSLMSASNESQTQITALNQEREVVRSRVEKMLRQMDELL